MRNQKGAVGFEPTSRRVGRRLDSSRITKPLLYPGCPDVFCREATPAFPLQYKKLEENSKKWTLKLPGVIQLFVGHRPRLRLESITHRHPLTNDLANKELQFGYDRGRRPALNTEPGRAVVQNSDTGYLYAKTFRNTLELQSRAKSDISDVEIFGRIRRASGLNETCGENYGQKEIATVAISHKRNIRNRFRREADLRTSIAVELV